MRHSDVRRFYSEHGEELQRYLTRRLNCAQTAADLTQDVFVRLMRSEAADAVENPRAYLYRIASNLLADHFRDARFIRIGLADTRGRDIEHDLVEGAEGVAHGHVHLPKTLEGVRLWVEVEGWNGGTHRAEWPLLAGP